ncbi:MULTISPECIES: hypothetical protein [Caballeronia]|jgi:hypothetical protein|nr:MULTISPECIES: hypothetical protein [Caballeronia]EKS67558.1 hypothetical protein BURK_021030 [Burkholderia sp. SJ98]MCG7403639.1 hypothetical protein [Caballeronia zhejiangensis]MCI1045548.1 hypothetical protein [Caballeronia zhejiangensis]MDR5765409.1 hypothetical protein [Caballeronia sp. LZ028]MDR5787114.1 hypothetical protein [Caballeronia sp. LP003]
MNLRRPASAPVRAIKKLLSHHEIATLLLLMHAPIDVMAATPDVASLQEYGYVEIVSPDAGTPKVRLTEDGNAVLRGLGVK